MRLSFQFLIALAAVLPCTAWARGFDLSLLKEGDILFQETVSDQATALKLATHSRYTHVGLVFQERGTWVVYEAVQPVRITPLSHFIQRGVKGHFVAKRVRNAEAILTPDALNKMKKQGASYMGRDYDLYFEWSDKRLYCTELVWKIYKDTLNVEVGRLQTLKDFDLAHPFVQGLMKQRYGAKIPYNEKVISVNAMFDSDQLTTVGIQD